MRVVCTFCGLFLAIAIVNCSPIVKRDAEELPQEDLSPLNEVSLVFYFFFLKSALKRLVVEYVIH